MVLSGDTKLSTILESRLGKNKKQNQVRGKKQTKTPEAHSVFYFRKSFSQKLQGLLYSLSQKWKPLSVETGANARAFVAQGEACALTLTLVCPIYRLRKCQGLYNTEFFGCLLHSRHLYQHKTMWYINAWSGLMNKNKQHKMKVTATAANTVSNSNEWLSKTVEYSNSEKGSISNSDLPA